MQRNGAVWPGLNSSEVRSGPVLSPTRDTRASRCPPGINPSAAFSFSPLQTIGVAVREFQALVLSLTRELATCVQSIVFGLGDYMNIHRYVCVGGISVDEHIQKLRMKNVKMFVLGGEGGMEIRHSATCTMS